jgi:integrase/recombinase XerD
MGGNHEVIDAFSKHQQARNLSRATIDRRRTSLSSLARFAEPVGILDVTCELLEDWTASYRNAETSHAYLADARALFRWARRRGLIERDPTEDVDAVRRPKPLPRPISEDDLVLSLATADERLRLVLLLGDLAGLRRAEIARLRGEDCTAQALLVRNGKGGKSRVIPMHPILWLMIKAWGAGHGYLFTARRGTHVSPETVGRWVRDHHRRLGISATLHQTRHHYGTALARLANGNLLAVAKLMGHERVSTTEGYVQFDTSGLAGLIEQLKPVA